MKRISTHLPSPAMMVSLLALFLALGGGSFAVASHLKVRASDIQNDAVRSKHVKNGQVRTPDLAGGAVATGKLRGGAVTAGKLRNNAVNSAKVADGSLTGADILESSLGQVPSADTANSATSAHTATNANQLGQVPAASYQRRCANGAARAFLEVRAASNFPSDYTTERLHNVFSCRGGPIRVKRTGPGDYIIDVAEGSDTAAGRASVPQVTVKAVTSDTVDDLATAWRVNLEPPLTSSVWKVHVRDGDGSARDTPFYITFF